MRSLFASLLLLTSAAPAMAQDADSALFHRVESYLDSLARADAFSGVVLLARRGQPVWEKAYGFADGAAQRLNDPETAFNLGSINKVFTRIAIMQLAAAGKLHLDSTLAAAWPDYPNAEVARSVTIRQILAHRSGIQGDIFAAPPGRTRHDVRHNNDYLGLFVNEPLAFQPGTRQQYSNAGYVVLGMLVERLSGKDYYRYVHDHVFAPAGMRRTGSFAVDSLPANTALGYTGGPDARRVNTGMLPGRGSAAGGGYSTAHDLMRFFQALRDGRIAEGPPPGGIGAAGGAPGINAGIEGELAGQLDLVVLTNLDPPAANRVSATIRRWLGASD